MKAPTKILLISTAITLSSIARGQLINTFPEWNGVTAIPFGQFGLVNTLGQVFTVDPAFTQLDAFEFGIGDSLSNPVNFSFNIAAWDPVNFHITGPLLYSSGLLSLPGNTSGFVPVVLPTGGLQLTGGAQYVGFLTASPYFDSLLDIALVPFDNEDVYSGGYVVALANGSNLNPLVSSTWFAAPADLAFAAAFSSAVPEPSTYGLASGIALIGAALLRRRKNLFRSIFH